MWWRQGGVTAKRKVGAPDGGGNGSRGGGDKRQGGMAAALLSCTIVVVVIVVVVSVAGVAGAEEGMCSGCSVFDFVFSVLRNWDSMRKSKLKKHTTSNLDMQTSMFDFQFFFLPST